MSVGGLTKKEGKEEKKKEKRCRKSSGDEKAFLGEERETPGGIIVLNGTQAGGKEKRGIFLGAGFTKAGKKPFKSVRHANF